MGCFLCIGSVEGGMGQVFKARNWKPGRIVALKLIRKEPVPITLNLAALIQVETRRGPGCTLCTLSSDTPWKHDWMRAHQRPFLSILVAHV